MRMACLDRDLAAFQQRLAVLVGQACFDFLRGRCGSPRHHGLWGWHVTIRPMGVACALSLVTGLAIRIRFARFVLKVARMMATRIRGAERVAQACFSVKGLCVHYAYACAHAYIYIYICNNICMHAWGWPSIRAGVIQ